jgi:hypothetical protein
MATKQETFNTVMELCETHKASKGLVAALTEILEPKGGGPVMNLSEVTKTDENGVITHVECSLSGVFLPASELYFYADKSGKSKLIGTDGVHLKRNSRQADRIKKAHEKTVLASEKAIMDDVLNGEITPEAGKAKVEKLRATAPDYSSVGELKETPAEA